MSTLFSVSRIREVTTLSDDDLFHSDNISSYNYSEVHCRLNYNTLIAVKIGGPADAIQCRVTITLWAAQW